MKFLSKFLSRLLLSFFFTLLSVLFLASPAFASTQTRFLYDGDGVRVAKIEEGKTTLYIGETEIDIEKGETTRYYSLGGKRIALRDSAGLKYIVSDHLSSLNSLISPAGTKLSEAKYYPYGQARTQTASLPSRQYTGQINDESTGLYFYNARYYNPITANFISADIIGNTNRYGYARGNPLTYIDPTGNEEENASSQNDCVSNPFSLSCLSLGVLPDTYTPFSATGIMNNTVGSPQSCYEYPFCSKEELQRYEKEILEVQRNFIFAAVGTTTIIAALPLVPVILSQMSGSMGVNAIIGAGLRIMAELLSYNKNSISYYLTNLGSKILEKVTRIPTVIDTSGFLQRAGDWAALRGTPKGNIMEIVISPSKPLGSFIHELTHLFQYRLYRGDDFFQRYSTDPVFNRQAEKLAQITGGTVHSFFMKLQPISITLERLANQINPK